MIKVRLAQIIISLITLYFVVLIHLTALEKDWPLFESLLCAAIFSLITVLLGVAFYAKLRLLIDSWDKAKDND